MTVVRFVRLEVAMISSRRSRARLFAGLAPLVVFALALPLLAPSCGDFQPGVKTFAKGSFIIPMDVCYQYQTDDVRSSYAPSSSCPPVTSGSQTDPGDVIKAYGLVYQLIRNGVPVYWIIENKTSLTSPDLTIQFNGGFPVYKYDWTGAPPSVAPHVDANHTISYLGGPFVVDGSDVERAGGAKEILQKYKSTFRPTASTGVNVHVSSVAFSARVGKMLAGGWSAGGAIPPKLALLNIGSSGAGSSKNSEVVIAGYLQRAGLDIPEPDPANPGVMLNAGGSATGVHGTIYDRLVLEDFLPATPGDWTTSNLARNQYQILWVPHWLAPGSCSDCPPGGTCSCNNRYSASQIASCLKTIGAFAASGKDVFAECAGLGSFEGVLNNSAYGIGGDANPNTFNDHFQTVPNTPLTGALSITTTTPGAAFYQPGYFASPLMQLGDYPFVPQSGAIATYDPNTATPYVNVGGATDNTVRLIAETSASGNDLFTWRPGLKTGHGTVVYLGGHSYSGTDGKFEVGGSRLVLNTLFNLGAACTSSGVACDTGLLGVCGRGVFTCASDGSTVCTQTVFPTAETCNGLDDNCDGQVDEGLDVSCYDGPTGTAGVGLCRAGVRSCQQNLDGSYGLSACHGQVLPAPEVCNGLDDNCDGQVDENLTQACYFGPTDTINPSTGSPYGVCKAGTQSCSAGSWGACTGQVLPSPEICDGLDNNCNGQVDEGCLCTPGTFQSCYSGPSGTAGVGSCVAGQTQCLPDGSWGPCTGEVLPVAEICPLPTGAGPFDRDCNGIADHCGVCSPGTLRACYTGPAGTEGVGGCQGGHQTCNASSEWGTECVGQTLPSQELCNGLDDNCNGVVDDGAQCGSGFACLNGVCINSACGAEVPCREGYLCSNDTSGVCLLTTCGTSGQACAPGAVCDSGTCHSPNDGLHCGPGSKMAGGFCTGGACYEKPCPDGGHCQDGTACVPGVVCADTGLACPGAQICQNGGCVADPCAGVVCPGGTFCRGGDCVQSCAFVSCSGSQACSSDGFCAPDPCAAKSCTPTQLCVVTAGVAACQDNPCLGIACGQGQRCADGTCLDDPCSGITCPVGQCLAGQCYAASIPAASIPAATTSKGGCGCGGGESSPLALLALMAALPLARRRRSGGGAALAAVVASLGLLGTGCQKTATPFDPASCALLSPALEVCTGESRCVDLAADPSHCGQCGHACSAGEICVPVSASPRSGACGPSTTVAPHLSSLSPGTASRGALTPVTVTAIGERIQAGATLRATDSTGNTTTLVGTAVSGGLSASLDLSTAAAGAWTLRVVNPDRVISNGMPLVVEVPAPVVSSVVAAPTPNASASPPELSAGGLGTLRLIGTGLMFDSACHIGGGALTDLELAATLTSTGLVCELDTTSITPGAYSVWVVNHAAPTDRESAHLPFLIASVDPVITAVAPSILPNDKASAVDVYGSGFDLTSQVWFTGPGFTSGVAQGTSYVNGGHLQVSQLDLTKCPPGLASPCAPGTGYGLVVHNGTSTSGAPFPLSVQTNVPTVTTLSPGSAYQGEQKTLTISGSGFSTTTPPVLQARPPGGSFADLAPTGTPTATSVSGVLDLIGSPPGSAPAGAWDVRLKFDSVSFSSTFPFRVLSNSAIITATPVPGGGVQGASPSVTLTVSNLRPTTPPLAGIIVKFTNASPVAPLPLQLSGTALSQPSAGQVAFTLPLADLPTGVYSLTVINPNGALPSNAANFSVSPGPPSLISVACASTGTGCTPGTPPSAAQQLTKVPLVITGHNFAQPDTSGNNGSTIHVYTGCTPVSQTDPTCICPTGTNPCVPNYVVPTADVTVTSATRLDVRLDTTAAVPGTYSFWVWNPGGSPSPQRSNRLTGAFTITP
jgi:hypothetical protein